MKGFNMSKFNRKSQLAKFRESINRNSYPRIEMFLLVSFTGMAGFLASYALLHAGLTTIWLRYLVSVGMAYGVFMVLLWFWLIWKTSNSTDSVDGLDLVDVNLMPNMRANSSPSFQGGGGTFDGGGASGDYESSSDGAGAVGEAFGAVAEAEEGAIPLIVIGALIFALLSIFWVVFSVVYSAPILFSELLVDGMLSASLYRRLKGIDKHHWLESAIKRTIWPFVFTAITFVALGFVIGHFVPDAHTLGEVISRWLAQ